MPIAPPTVDTVPTSTATEQEVQAAIQSLRQRVQGAAMSTAPALSTPQQPTAGRMMDAVDYTGKDVTIFSTTGKVQTEDAFARAMDQYNKSKGTVPEGFTVLPSRGIMSTVRQGFERVNAPVQQAAQTFDRSVGNLENTGQQAVLQLLDKLGIQRPDVKPFKTDSGLATTLAESVNTPGKAAFQGGLAAATAGMGSTAGLTGTALLTQLAKNAAIGGIGGAGGYAAGTLATGEPLSLQKTGTEFAIAAGAGGTVGILSHFLSKYLPAEAAKDTAGEILNVIKTKYPNVANDPAILDAFMSSEDNISRLTQIMSKALRGNIDDLVKNAATDINTVLPRNLTKGSQNTMRAELRKIMSAGNDILDNLDDSKAIATARKDMSDATMAIKSLVMKEFGTQKTVVNTINNVDNVLLKHDMMLDNFTEGAQVLNLLKQSGAGGGYSPEKFQQVIQGVYQQQPGSLLEQVGQILGGGRPLTGMAPTGGTAANAPMESAQSQMLQMARRGAGLVLPQWIMQLIPKRATVGATSVARPYATAAGNVAGAAALRSFVEDSKP